MSGLRFQDFDQVVVTRRGILRVAVQAVNDLPTVSHP
jgi:hypothetical protein